MYLKLPERESCCQLRRERHITPAPKFGRISRTTPWATSGAQAACCTRWSCSTHHSREETWTTSTQKSCVGFIQRSAPNFREIWTTLSNACSSKSLLIDLQLTKFLPWNKFSDIFQTIWKTCRTMQMLHFWARYDFLLAIWTKYRLVYPNQIMLKKEIWKEIRACQLSTLSSIRVKPGDISKISLKKEKNEMILEMVHDRILAMALGKSTKEVLALVTLWTFKPPYPRSILKRRHSLARSACHPSVEDLI